MVDKDNDIKGSKITFTVLTGAILKIHQSIKYNIQQSTLSCILTNICMYVLKYKQSLHWSL